MRNPDRRVRATLAALAAVLALAATAVPVAARPPVQVTIVSHVTFNPEGPNYGTFVASGDAVDAGLLCPAGTFEDTGILFAGDRNPLGSVQLQVLKTFTCDDGSGTFDVKMQIQADFNTGIETFSWVLRGGTGDYDDARGSGRGSTVPNPPIGNINTYEGFILP